MGATRHDGGCAALSRTYTFEDGVLTFFNADDSYCPGAVVVWEVTFPKMETSFRKPSFQKPAP